MAFFFGELFLFFQKKKIKSIDMYICVGKGEKKSKTKTKKRIKKNKKKLEKGSGERVIRKERRKERKKRGTLFFFCVRRELVNEL